MYKNLLELEDRFSQHTKIIGYGMYEGDAGGGIAAIGTLENYMCSALRGDASVEALAQAAIGGGVEGLTAGALHWVGKKWLEKQLKMKLKSYLMEKYLKSKLKLSVKN